MYRRTAGSPGILGGRGFTLIETLIALSVVSVAVAIFVNLYGDSLGLGRLAHERAVAAEAAQTQLALITRSPGMFLWKAPSDAAEVQFPILASEDDPKAGNIITPPSAMPADENADERARIAYENFRWRAFGRLPKDKEHCEVTVVVTWKQGGREEMLALTSAVPRSAVPAAVAAAEGAK